jgi:hypothetical protein
VLGKTVGFINGWNPTQSRTVTPIYEVNVDGSGNPVEYMPGNITGLNISISRYDIYKTRMEEVFGTPDLVMLTRQSEPFDVHEVWAVSDPEKAKYEREAIEEGARIGERGLATFINPFTKEERFIYSGCWFTSLGRTIRSDDNRIINVNATLVYTKKMKSTGLVGGVA